MTKFKGPAFPSFFNQQTPQPRMQYLSHCGKRQQMRNLRHACKKILDAKQGTIEWTVLQRVIDVTKDEPEPEFGKLHLIHAALDASDQTGESWVTAMTYFLDKFEDARDNPPVENHNDQPTA